MVALTWITPGLRAVLGKWKTFSHGLGHERRSGRMSNISGIPKSRPAALFDQLAGPHQGWSSIH
jgi:hypothetical protein